jgi:hypothetical protein
MAHDGRHAAWQTERRFAVRLLPEDGPPADLASGLTEFLDAFDLASEWVRREDPGRDGTASLEIVETNDGVAQQVWTYAPAQPPADLSPLTWPRVPDFATREKKSRLRERIRPVPVEPARPSSPPLVVASPKPEIERTEIAQVRETSERWMRTSVEAAWNDRLARCCLIGSGASLWFSVGLADPHFLLPLLLSIPALWWRQRSRDASPPQAEPDDWM